MNNNMLNSDDNITKLLRDKGINSWLELMTYIKSLPYGRTSNRHDLSLVITESKGTCSSKHGLLKKVADLNNIPKIKLMLGIYKMNTINTPKIGDVLEKNKLEYIPEAHCYLSIDNEPTDLTSINADFNRIKSDIILEIEILPDQVGEFKVEYHKEYLRSWLIEKNIGYSFEHLWKIREKCIEKLSE